MLGDSIVVTRSGSATLETLFGSIKIILFSWLKIEQRLVELDIAVKTSLNLERPSPDR